MKRLGSDLTSAQKEMKTKHKAYENAVSILSRRLQEALTAKEAADAELSQLRAQSTVGGSDPTLHVGKHLCHHQRQEIWHRERASLRSFSQKLCKRIDENGGRYLGDIPVKPCLVSL